MAQGSPKSAFKEEFETSSSDNSRRGSKDSSTASSSGSSSTRLGSSSSAESLKKAVVTIPASVAANGALVPQDVEISAPPKASMSPKSFWKWLREPRPLPPVPEKRTVTPEYTASLLSKITFQWMTPLMSVGFRRPLKLNDIWLINPNRSVHVHDELVRATFKKYAKAGYKYPLFWTLHDTFKVEFWIAGACRLTADLFVVFTPYTLRYLIEFVMESYYAPVLGFEAPPLWHGIALVAAIAIMIFVQSTCTNQFSYYGSMAGQQARAVVMTAIFDKTLRISARAKNGVPTLPAAAAAAAAGAPGEKGDAGKSGASAEVNEKSDAKAEEKKAKKAKKTAKKEDTTGWTNGKVIQMMSVDAGRIDAAIGLIHFCWTSFVVIIIATSLLLVNLGVSALAGTAVLVLGFAVAFRFVGMLVTRRKLMNKASDARITLTVEVLQAIRLVKYFGWEPSFLEKVVNMRLNEMKGIQLYMAVRNFISALTYNVPVLMSMVGFTTYAVTHDGLSPAIVFSSVALFNSMRVPLNYLPMCSGLAVDAWTAMQRIQKYLLEEEVQEHPIDLELKQAVKLENAYFTWEKSAQAHKLQQMAMLAALKGGKPKAPSAAQLKGMKGLNAKPFGFENVTLDIHRGELVAIVGGIASGKSSLLSAMAGEMRMSAGQVTMGGSRAYCAQHPWIQNASVKANVTFGVKLDEEWYNEVVTACSLKADFDSLPAGDQTEIGERGINLSGGQKQRISLARAIYSKADVLLMDDPLSAVDSFVGKHIMESAICGVLKDRTRILATHQMHVLGVADRIIWMDKGKIRAFETYNHLMANEPEFSKMVHDVSNAQSKAGGGVDGAVAQAEAEKKKADAPKSKEEVAAAAKALLAKKALMVKEQQGEHAIPWKIYVAWFKSANCTPLFLTTIPLLICAQGTNVITGQWLSWWSSERYPLERNQWIAIFVCLCVAQLVFLYLFGLSLAICSTRASNNMLDKATRKVFHAPTSFFDTTPLGRITNRFSKDVDTMDYTLTETIRMYTISLTVMSSIFILILVYFYWFAVALGAVIPIFFFAGAYYRASALEIKRHEATLRSVVFARFSEGLTGVACIRGYNSQDRFVESLKNALDLFNSAYSLTSANQRWLSSRLDVVGMTLITSLGAVVVIDRFTQMPSTAGLVLSYLMGVVQILPFVVRQFADVENAMNSAERLYEYGEEIPEEGFIPDRAPPRAPATSWPESGEIVFSNVRMRYRPNLPEVLQGFNLHVRAGERIGIIGRTGAGKSSIITALFRMTELSGGSISIDGQDISNMPLADLRSELSIIPQDTTLFRGTIRSNLDPFNTRADWQLLNALRQAGMWDLGLDDAVDEEGNNFSLGQRQLLALARVLVRGSRIVVCDEATSNVDLETDERIQTTMTDAFRGKTVLTIAHRIRTIVGYDRICVVHQGQIAELGTPRELWNLKGGIFRGMCERSGIGEAEFRDGWFEDYDDEKWDLGVRMT